MKFGWEVKVLYQACGYITYNPLIFLILFACVLQYASISIIYICAYRYMYNYIYNSNNNN